MGQKSGFFTSNGGDRKYGADWLAQFTAAIISNGVYTTELTVSGGNGNMSITLGTGRAWINGYMYSNDANMTLALAAADGVLSRTDLVVLRLDMTNRQITLAVVQGTFGGGVPAITRTADIYELELAKIAVVAGTTAITQAMITDTRADETVCGIVAGAVTQLSTGELLNQLKAGFDTWFANIKGQLSTDAAGNLQNEIDALPSTLKVTDTVSQAIFGDTADHTGSEAFLKVNDKIKSVYQIADIKQSARTDLGDNWLLCNGAGIRRTVYPDLFDNLHSTPYWYYSSWADATGITTVKGLKYYNNLYILFGANSSGCPTIAYSDKFAQSATWTTLQIATNTWEVHNFCYVNGYYILMVSNYIYYSSTLGSGWSSWVSTASQPLNGIVYANGYYVGSVCGGDKAGYICYSTDLTSWTAVAVNASLYAANCYSTGICFDGTNFVVCLRDSTTVYLYYATIPTSWTLGTSQIVPQTAYSYYISGFGYANGKIMVQFTANSSPYYTYLLYTDSVTAAMTVTLLASGTQLSPAGEIVYLNGYYFIPMAKYSSNIPGAYLWYSTDLSSFMLASPSPLYRAYGNICVIWDEEKYIVTGANTNSECYVSESTLITGDARVIPTISVSGAYAYIKALN